MTKMSRQNDPAAEPDYYEEGPYVVFTRSYHLRRGSCCGSGCRHCPYVPRWTRGATRPDSQEPPASPAVEPSGSRALSS